MPFRESQKAAGSPRDLLRTATIIGGRHALVVGTTEDDAGNVVRILRELDLEAAPLEGGIDGWRAAVVEECDEFQNSIEVIGLLRIAYGVRSYIMIADREAVVFDPSGSVDCFVEELEDHHCQSVTVVDSGYRRNYESCGRELSRRVDGEYVAVLACE